MAGRFAPAMGQSVHLVNALPHVRHQSVKLLKTKYTNQFAAQCAQIVKQIKLGTHYTQFPKCHG